MVGDVFMTGKTERRWKSWETALLLALCLCFLSGAWAADTQTRLAGSLVRLHVVARSNSDADQAAKLEMRDKVLALLSPLLAECGSREEAVDIILNQFPALEALGDVAVSLDTEYYPTREYAGFSLPAGEYLSLRVVMGPGAGHNWWCVVFPPLCTEALAQPAADAFALLPEDGAELIAGDGTGYILRFRLAEWWGQLARWLSAWR